MKYSLVGHTGFVGGNLAASHTFTNLYRSTDIESAFGADNGLVVYAGMPAEKFTANQNPKADFARAKQAMDNIVRMKPEKLVLISTVDVYPKTQGVYEDSAIEGEAGQAYGKNRLALEGWVRQAYGDALIVRLCGLFGEGIKKNFIFDMLHLTPAMLREDKYAQLAGDFSLIKKAYQRDASGFYRLQKLPAGEAARLEAFFEAGPFNALCFTDSRSVYQFYDLAHLWSDIRHSLKAGLKLVNLVTQPVEAGMLYHVLHGKPFENHLPAGPVRYDVRTRYGRELGGNDNYIADRDDVVAGIARFAQKMLARTAGAAKPARRKKQNGAGL